MESHSGREAGAAGVLTMSKATLISRKRAIDETGARINLASVSNKLLFPAANWEPRPVLIETKGDAGQEAAAGSGGGSPKLPAGQGGRLQANAEKMAREQEELGGISLATKFIFATPAAGWFGCRYMKDTYMKKFYTDDWPRTPLGAIAFILVLGVIVDAFTDPWFAQYTDNFLSRFGRRKPFLLFSCLYLPIVMVFSFLPPGPVWDFSGDADYSSENVRNNYQMGIIIWYGIFHIGFKLADTLICKNG